MLEHTRLEALRKRHNALKTERQSFDDHWKSLVKPRRERFFTQDRNKGDRR
jgi:hypothetical protein|tara:strand:+ start:4934 stop:5086 length:153 start_codon:yes stop_codon:yes gene_type:complete